jgi:transposase
MGRRRKAVICVSTREATLKKRLRRHLRSLGLHQADDGVFAPPGTGKDVIRTIHSVQRDDRLAQLLTYTANMQTSLIGAADAGCTRIRQIPGIGPIVATAIVAAIGNESAFHKGREFAAWLGLVPRQYATGGKAKRLGISKRGNVYRRKILIHGARASVLRISEIDPRSVPG